MHIREVLKIPKIYHLKKESWFSIQMIYLNDWSNHQVILREYIIILKHNSVNLRLIKQFCYFCDWWYYFELFVLNLSHNCLPISILDKNEKLFILIHVS